MQRPIAEYGQGSDQQAAPASKADEDDDDDFDLFGDDDEDEVRGDCQLLQQK